MNAEAALGSIWSDLDMPPAALAAVRIMGVDPVLPSSFAVGTMAASTIAAAALAASSLWQLRTGRLQELQVAMRHACAEFHSEHFLLIDGVPAVESGGEITGLYPTGDGGWVRLHANFPHFRAGLMMLLGCAATHNEVAQALLGWTAFEFEAAATQAGLAVAALRSFAEWDAHPQGLAVATLPLIRLERISDAPPERLPDAVRPLGGVRVLDLTRVIAGPVSGRTLAAHGADVMNVTGPGLPSYRTQDLGRGKLAAQLDLRTSEGRQLLGVLIGQADVFVQGYRPGAIAARGFSPLSATALRPGLITASLSAYGATGPWSDRRGFDSLVQTASGFNIAEAQAAGQARPRPLPVQALDHGTGYLLAAGIMAALYRRATVGGSWHVSVSLARTGLWLRSLGLVADGFAVPAQDFAAIADLMETTPSGFGTMTAVRHAAELSETPARWVRPSVPLGSNPSAWPVRFT